MNTSLISSRATKESPIDERYRLMLLNQYLKNIKEVPVAYGRSKWIFCCPLCSSLGRTKSKRNERKGALLWNNLQNSWVFFCAKEGSPQCSDGGKTYERFLSALDNDLAEHYRIERWQSGATGKGHNTKRPKSISGLSTVICDSIHNKQEEK
jgi:hypothetical protein